MRYVSAYLLSVLGGNEQPKIDDLKKILGSVGIDCEEDKAKLVIDNLSGKNLPELLEAGKEKLASVPSGGGGAVAVAAGAAAAGGAAPAEEKKEEKKAESESEDEDMGFGLFD